jgi:hypothetical protein
VATFKEIAGSDVKTSRSVLNQLVDVIQEDISGSATRKSYQQFVTGGIGPGVTSSLYQTVFDQDFTLQTANPLLDMTVGIYESSATVASSSTGTDSNGKLLFPSQSLMMREKVDIYRQYAANLLGDSSLSFSTPFGSTNTDDQVDNAAFISFKRLFTRDKIKRETFAMKMYQFANGADVSNRSAVPYGVENLFQTSTGSASIFTDFGSSTNRRRTFGGEVGNLVDSTDSSKNVGLIFYDAGTIVLNLGGRGNTSSQLRAVASDQFLSGAISCMSPTSPATNTDLPYGKEVMNYSGQSANGGYTVSKFVPDLMVSASIDDIVDHLAQTRFSSGSLTAATFQNNTNINSTLIFCRATADEFNYSSNPTYTDSSNRIRVIEQGQEDVQRSFTYITTVGLYDVNDNLLAVAKLSRPIEKNDEKDLTVRVRLDF